MEGIKNELNCYSVLKCSSEKTSLYLTLWVSSILKDKTIIEVKRERERVLPANPKRSTCTPLGTMSPQRKDEVFDNKKVYNIYIESSYDKAGY